jgi:hypothetical protein
MAKYLILWEEDTSRVPADPNERAALISKQMELTKKALDERQVTDWGIYAGGNAGYAISERTPADALMGVMQFSPYIKFQVHPVLSLAEAAEVMKSMKR